MFSHNFPLFVW